MFAMPTIFGNESVEMLKKATRKFKLHFACCACTVHFALHLGAGTWNFAIIGLVSTRVRGFRSGSSSRRSRSRSSYG